MTNSNLQTKNHRAAFTLVELLLVVAIIGVLASLALAVVAGAQDEAKRAATLARVNQIRTFLLDRIEEYETRKIPIALNGYGLTQAEQRQIGQRIIADLVFTEMPVPTFNDVTEMLMQPELQNYPSDAFRQWLTDFEMQSQSQDFAQSIIDELELLQPAMIERIRERSMLDQRYNLPGEFLYEVLRTTDRDGQSGIEILTNRAVTDVDIDDVPEVSDAWGEPFGIQINFVNEALDQGQATLLETIRNVRFDGDPANISFMEINSIRVELISDNLQ